MKRLVQVSTSCPGNVWTSASTDAQSRTVGNFPSFLQTQLEAAWQTLQLFQLRAAQPTDSQYSLGPLSSQDWEGGVNNIPPFDLHQVSSARDCEEPARGTRPYLLGYLQHTSRIANQDLWSSTEVLLSCLMDEMGITRMLKTV